MNTGEVLMLLAVIALGIIAVSCLYFLRSATRAMRELEQTSREIRERGIPLIEDMHTVAVDTHEELRRVDDVLDTAQSLTGTVDAAGRLAYLAVTNPVVKGAAIATGVKGATKTIVRGK